MTLKFPYPHKKPNEVCSDTNFICQHGEPTYVGVAKCMASSRGLSAFGIYSQLPLPVIDEVHRYSKTQITIKQGYGKL